MPFIVNTTPGDFVNFIRGSEQAYAKLVKKDPGTLYFISDKDAETGKLYLGEKQIVCDAASIKSLNDLIEVEGESVSDGSLIQFNGETGKWQATKIQDILEENGLTSIEKMTGASEEADGESGLVPAPTKGQQDFLLSGAGTWVSPQVLVSDAVSAEVSAQLADIVDGAPEELDTLKEIADWIQKHEDVTDVVQITGKVENLEKLLNDQEIEGEDGEVTIQPGLVSKVESLETLLNDQEVENEEGEVETKFGLVSTVANLQSELDKLSSSVEENSTAIEAVEDRLKWYDMELAETSKE